MQSAGHCKIWTLSENQNEYERFERFLSGENKHHVNVSEINAALLEQSLTKLSGQLSITVIHDPSDIRKPHSSKMEDLDQVRSLGGKMIPGYKTFSSVALDEDRKQIHLLSCLPKAATETEESGLDSPTFRQQPFTQITQISQSLRAANPQAVLTHVMDREYDDQACFELIDKELGDQFVIRLKLNRISSEKAWDEKKGKEVSLKLKARQLRNRFTQSYETFSWGGRVYPQVKAHFSYETIEIAGGTYGLVKVELRTRKGKKIFKEPMVLLSNFFPTNEAIALLIFRSYLRRAKIEGVFKFLKEHMGWESFQVRELLTIQHIIVLCFFIGGFFYEIESELTQNPWMVQLCQFGGGKGKVTKVYFLRGLAKIANYLQISAFMRKNNLTEEQMIQLFQEE